MERRQLFNMYEEEDLEVCPYNNSHCISTKRMTIHVEKCRKIYLEEMLRKNKNPDMVCCKHNRTHHMPRIELTYHEMRCDDQFGSYDPYHKYFKSDPIDKYLNKERPRSLSFYMPPPFLNVPATKDEFENRLPEEYEEPNDEDDWTLIPGGLQYDPKQKLEDELVLYLPRGLSKSEREKYVQKNIEKAKTIKNFKGLPTKITKEKEMNQEIKDNVSDISDLSETTVNSEVNSSNYNYDGGAETDNDEFDAYSNYSI